MLFDKNWFLKHQKKLLWCLNAPLVSIWFRWLLCINGNRSSVGKNKITAILPNAIFWGDKKKGKKIERHFEFRTHSKFSKRLYYGLKPLWYLFHFTDWLVLDRYAIKFNPNISFGFTNFGPVFPDPGDPGTTSTSGDVSRGVAIDETWANIRANAGDGHRTSNGANSAVFLEANTTSGHYDLQRRFVMLFDTSSIGGGNTVTSATVSMWGRNANAAGLGSTFIEIVKPGPASNTTLANADYNIASWDMTAQATHLAWASWTAAQYNDFALNATGLANVAITGITKLGSTSDLDMNNTTPTWASTAADSQGTYDAGQTGTSNDPKLAGVYTAAAASTNVSWMSMLGVGQ